MNPETNVAQQKTQVTGDTLFYSRACLEDLCNGPLDLPVLNASALMVVATVEETTKTDNTEDCKKNSVHLSWFVVQNMQCLQIVFCRWKSYCMLKQRTSNFFLYLKLLAEGAFFLFPARSTWLTLKHFSTFLHVFQVPLQQKIKCTYLKVFCSHIRPMIFSTNNIDTYINVFMNVIHIKKDTCNRCFV